MTSISDLVAISAARTVTGSIYEMPIRKKTLASGPAYALIVTNGRIQEVDQICSTEREANRERKDLIAMDCGKVTIKRFDSWADAHAYEDKLRGY